VKIVVAGATQTMGRRLVPLLESNGHTVVGTTLHAQQGGGACRRRRHPTVLSHRGGLSRGPASRKASSASICDREVVAGPGHAVPPPDRPVGRHQLDLDRSRS
jgi:nucleoside-diphosphate-sugar epimerase